MKRTILNKIICILSIFLFITPIAAVETLSNTNKQFNMNIEGEFQSTVVSFTVPQSISFVLNPNGITPEERFSFALTKLPCS